MAIMRERDVGSGRKREGRLPTHPPYLNFPLADTAADTAAAA